MKRISIFLALGAGLWWIATSADGQEKNANDANVRKMLVGKWTQEITSKELSLKMSLTVNMDGTFALFGMVKIEAGAEKTATSFNHIGTWKVARGEIELTIMKSDGPAPIPEGGRLEILPIIEINETTLKVGKVDPIGSFSEFKRIKDSQK